MACRSRGNLVSTGSEWTRHAGMRALARALLVGEGALPAIPEVIRKHRITGKELQTSQVRDGSLGMIARSMATLLRTPPKNHSKLEMLLSVAEALQLTQTDLESCALRAANSCVSTGDLIYPEALGASLAPWLQDVIAQGGLMTALQEGAVSLIKSTTDRDFGGGELSPVALDIVPQITDLVGALVPREKRTEFSRFLVKRAVEVGSLGCILRLTEALQAGIEPTDLSTAQPRLLALVSASVALRAGLPGEEESAPALGERLGLPEGAIRLACAEGLLRGYAGHTLGPAAFAERWKQLVLVDGMLPDDLSVVVSTRVLPEIIEGGSAKSAFLRSLLEAGVPGVSKRAALSSIEQALTALIEQNRFGEYGATLTDARLTNEDLRSTNLGRILSGKLSQAVEEHNASVALQLAPRLTSVAWLKSQLVRSFLGQLQSGDWNTQTLELVLRCGATPQDFQQPEARKIIERAVVLSLRDHYGSSVKGLPVATQQLAMLLASPARAPILALKACRLLLREGRVKAAEECALQSNLGLDSPAANADVARVVAQAFRRFARREEAISGTQLVASGLWDGVERSSSAMKQAALAIAQRLIADGQVILSLGVCRHFELDPKQMTGLVAVAAAKRIRSGLDFEGILKLGGRLTKAGFDLSSAEFSDVRAAVAEHAKVDTEQLREQFAIQDADLQAAHARLIQRSVDGGAFTLAMSLMGSTSLAECVGEWNADRPRLIRGVQALLVHGFTAEVQQICACDPSLIREPCLQEAAKVGILAEMELGDGAKADAIKQQFQIDDPTYRTLLIEAQTRRLIEAEAGVVPASELAPQDAELCVARASLGCLQSNDLERVEQLQSLGDVPGVAKRSPELRRASRGLLAELCRLGWKEQTLGALTRLFPQSAAFLRGTVLRAAVSEGIEREIRASLLEAETAEQSEKRLLAAAQLGRWAKLTPQQYGSVALEATLRLHDQYEMPFWTFCDRLGILAFALGDPRCRDLGVKHVVDFYAQGEGEHAEELLQRLGLPPQMIKEVRAEGVMKLLQCGKFGASRGLATSISMSPDTPLAAASHLPRSLLLFAKRHDAVTLGQLWELGERYLEPKGASARTKRHAGKAKDGLRKTVKKVSRGGGVVQWSTVAEAPDFVACGHQIEPFPQEREFTCGAACLRMAIAALSGISYPEATVCRWLGTTQEVGTPLRLFRKLDLVLPNLRVHVGVGGTLAALQRHLRHGAVVIVNFREPNSQSPHYAVVHGVSSMGIQLIDPTYGRVSLDPRMLDWTGGYGEGRVRGGYVALYPPKQSVLEGRKVLARELPATAVVSRFRLKSSRFTSDEGSD